MTRSRVQVGFAPDPTRRAEQHDGPFGLVVVESGRGAFQGEGEATGFVCGHRGIQRRRVVPDGAVGVSHLRREEAET